MKKLGLSILVTAICISRSWAGDEPPTIESNKNLIDLVQSHADYVWTLVAAALVFFMQAGFAMVESGFTRAKNAVNIYDEKSDGFFHGITGVLCHWVRNYVRCHIDGMVWHLRFLSVRL